MPVSVTDALIMVKVGPVCRNFSASLLFLSVLYQKTKCEGLSLGLHDNVKFSLAYAVNSCEIAIVDPERTKCLKAC